MKTKLPVVLFLFIMINITTKTNAQILTNGSFESWTISGGYMNPTGWFTTNGITLEPTVGQGPPLAGVYSARLMTDTMAGSYWGGQVSLHYTGSVKPLAVSGFWKGTLVGVTDEVAGTVLVYDGTMNPIGVGSDYILSTLNNWTAFNMVVNYTSSNAPGSTDILITLFTTAFGSEAFLDDLSMTYITGTNDIITSHLPGVTIAQGTNNTNCTLYADVLSADAMHIDVFNVNGERVYSYDEHGFSGHHEINIPTGTLPAGMYLCRVTGADVNRSVNFIKN